MSNIIIERKQIVCSDAQLAAMYLNDEITSTQYFEVLKIKESSKPKEAN